MIEQKLSSKYIKDSIKPLDFYRHELPNVPFKKLGWNDGGLCPFHSDNKAGTFRINIVTGAFCCFSCSVKGGSIIGYTMEKDGLNFDDALEQLADDWGLV